MIRIKRKVISMIQGFFCLFEGQPYKFVKRLSNDQHINPKQNLGKLIENHLLNSF